MGQLGVRLGIAIHLCGKGFTACALRLHAHALQFGYRGRLFRELAGDFL